jgi:hypothetical protein
MHDEQLIRENAGPAGRGNHLTAITAIYRVIEKRYPIILGSILEFHGKGQSIRPP